MSKNQKINSLLPDNDTRAIEPKHLREAFKIALGNVATIDYTDENRAVHQGNTYTKVQVNDFLDTRIENPSHYYWIFNDVRDENVIKEGFLVTKADDQVDTYAVSVHEFIKLVGKNVKILNNATGDDTYTHEVVAKPDGSLGIRPIPVYSAKVLHNIPIEGEEDISDKYSISGTVKRKGDRVKGNVRIILREEFIHSSRIVLGNTIGSEVVNIINGHYNVFKMKDYVFKNNIRYDYEVWFGYKGEISIKSLTNTPLPANVSLNIDFEFSIF